MKFPLTLIPPSEPQVLSHVSLQTKQSLGSPSVPTKQSVYEQRPSLFTDLQSGHWNGND